MSSQEDLDECFEQIQDLISTAEKAKINKAAYAKDKIKSATDAINRYQGYVKTDESRDKFILYKQQIKQIEKLGMTGQRKKQMDVLDEVDEETQKKFKIMKQDINSALTQGQLAMQELNRQIEALDQLHNVNNDNFSELKRIKSSLNTLLRGVMADKCTCFLIVLLLLGIIAVLVIYFVKRKSNTA